jgi:hypothetical protein
MHNNSLFIPLHTLVNYLCLYFGQFGHLGTPHYLLFFSHFRAINIYCVVYLRVINHNLATYANRFGAVSDGGMKKVAVHRFSGKLFKGRQIKVICVVNSLEIYNIDTVIVCHPSQ